jgi:hypothetical protein
MIKYLLIAGPLSLFLFSAAMAQNSGTDLEQRACARNAQSNWSGDVGDKRSGERADENCASRSEMIVAGCVTSLVIRKSCDQRSLPSTVIGQVAELRSRHLTDMA